MGEPEILVSVTIRCGDCGSKYGVNEILDKKHCQCHDKPKKEQATQPSPHKSVKSPDTPETAENESVNSESNEPQQKTLSVISETQSK